MDFGPPHYYAHTNYVTIIVPSQSCLLSFLHHPYMRPFSICKIFHLLVIINFSCKVYYKSASVLSLVMALALLQGMAGNKE